MPSEVFQIQILLEYLSNHWLLNIARRPEGRVANTHSQSKFKVWISWVLFVCVSWGVGGVEKLFAFWLVGFYTVKGHKCPPKFSS